VKPVFIWNVAGVWLLLLATIEWTNRHVVHAGREVGQQTADPASALAGCLNANGL
jgi:hypothetical protein